MIRVNLLPVQKSRRRSQGRTQLILFIGVIVIEIAMLAVVYFLVSQDAEEARQHVQELEEEIEELEAQDEGLDEMIAEAEMINAQLDAIETLAQQRTGPVEMLDELQLILSPIEDEEYRLSHHHEEWREDWDPRQVWLESFVEEEEGQTFRLEGRATGGGNVSELLARLNTATYFNDVKFDYIEREGDDDDSVSFEMFGEYDYTGFPDPDDDES